MEKEIDTGAGMWPTDGASTPDATVNTADEGVTSTAVAAAAAVVMKVELAPLSTMARSVLPFTKTSKTIGGIVVGGSSEREGRDGGRGLRALERW